LNFYGVLQRCAGAVGDTLDGASGCSWVARGQLRVPVLVAELAVELSLADEALLRDDDGVERMAEISRQQAPPYAAALLCDLRPSDGAGIELGSDDTEDGDEVRAVQEVPTAKHEQALYVLRDLNNCIPLAHSGMFVSAQVVRGALRAAACDQNDARAYVHDVRFVRSVRPAATLFAPRVLAGIALPVAPSGFWCEQVNEVAKAHKRVANFRTAVQASDVSETTTLAGVQRAARTDNNFANCLHRDAQNYFCNALGLLVGPAGAKQLGRHCTPLDLWKRLGCSLAPPKAALTRASLAEARAVATDLSRRALSESLFYGVLDVLPLAASDAPLASNLMARPLGDGVRSSAALARLMAQTGVNDVGDIARTVQALCNAAVRSEARSGETVHDLASLLRVAFGAQQRPTALVEDAIAVLRANGAFVRPPRVTLQRLSVAAFAAPTRHVQLRADALYCTERALRRSERLAGALRTCAPTLLVYVSGAEAPTVEMPDALFVCAGPTPQPFARNSAHLSRAPLDRESGTMALPLDSLIEGRARTAPPTLIFLGRHVVLWDAHLCDELALLRFMQLARVAARVTLAGDVRLSSVFAAVWRTRYFASDECGAAAPLAVSAPAHYDEFGEIFAPSAARDGSARASSASADSLRSLISRAHFDAAARRRVTSIVSGDGRCAAEPQQLLKDSLADALSARRWLICASSRNDTEHALKALALASDSLPATQRALLRVAANPHLATDLIFLASPFVRVHRTAFAVSGVFVRQEAQTHDGRFSQSMCMRVRGDRALSLDSADLLLQLDAPCSTVDHRKCCGTWHRNVMHVARHRAHVRGAAFVRSHGAAPLARSAKFVRSTVLYADTFRFDDVYAALVAASPFVTDFEHVIGADAKEHFEDAMRARYGWPKRCVGDLLY